MDKYENYIAYVGTYTNGESKGIYTFRLEQNGKLTQVNFPYNIDNPSYINFSRNRRFLYAVIEEETFQGEHGGGVASFKIGPNNGELELLNFKGTQGVSPCHLITDKSDKYLIAANYTEGTFSVFDVLEDGSIGELRSAFAHDGRGINTDRQEKAHVHYVAFSRDERFLFAVDLGIDKIKIYSLSQETGEIKPAGEYEAKPGSGPRHIEFHPNGRYVYLICELSSEITVLKYSNHGKVLETIQYISTLPKDFTGYNTSAAVHISKDGRFLYASNRGHDSIAAFRIDETTGRLELISITSTRGEFPRDFEIDPDGRFLFSANQNSGTITAFELDNTTGELIPLEFVIDIPNPTCIKFYE